MSCELCANIHPPELQNLPPGSKAKIPKWISVGGLKSSSCDECQLVWRALQLYTSEFKDDDFVELLIARDQPLRVKYRAPKYSIELFTRSPHTNGITQNGTAQKQKDPKAPYIGPTIEVSENSGSETSLALAASWLKKCRADHPRCQMPGDLPMPTRVIDVGLEGVREPFLFETKGSACKNKPYIALSYCWGWWEQHPPMKTVKKDFPEFKLKANYQEHLEAIKFSHMPKTIQDAVTITRKLGIQYLWVDALCIIQHDAEEWIRESGKMCDVYSNALLTISATQAEGSSVGIFGKQWFGSQTRSLGKLRDGREVYTRANIAKYHNDCDWGLLFRVPISADWSADTTTTEPLAARAWCMQESVLSNRILHYTSDEMMWECNEAGWCECGLGETEVDVTENPNVVLRRSDVLSTEGYDMSFFWRNVWSNYVHVFTRRSITDKKDKLPALSGLARKFSDLLTRHLGRQPTYLAGLWGDELLVRSLCWYVTYTAASWRSDNGTITGVYDPRRAEPWRAPTWSFMSLDAPISPMDALRVESAVEVLEATAEPLDRAADPFGQVASAKLVLRGRLIRDLSCQYSGTDFHLDESHYSNDKITFRLFDKGERSLPFICDDPSSVLPGRSSGYSLLLLGYKVIAKVHEPCFLVLRAAGKSQAGCYERIGLADERALPGHQEGEWDSRWAEDPNNGELTDVTIV